VKTQPIFLKILNALSVLMFLVGVYLAVFWAPTEASMGDVQRVFYFHVSVGWVGAIGYLLAVVAGIAYLRTTDNKWDIIGVAGVEVGLVFAFLNIVTGSIWAKPVWNVWWNWDPRLVTATISELIYIAYMMLRQGIDDPERRARFGAIYAIIGFISVPLSFLSIRIWRTIHPVVIASSDPGADGTFNMTADMKVAFFFSLATFTVIGATLLWHRIRIGNLSHKVEQLKMKLYE
jgi:heme exporter protein C